jgi:hypothetical protein
LTDVSAVVTLKRRSITRLHGAVSQKAVIFCFGLYKNRAINTVRTYLKNGRWPKQVVEWMSPGRKTQEDLELDGWKESRMQWQRGKWKDSGWIENKGNWKSVGVDDVKRLEHTQVYICEARGWVPELHVAPQVFEVGQPCPVPPFKHRGSMGTFCYVPCIYLVKSVSYSVNMIGGTEFPDGGIRYEQTAAKTRQAQRSVAVGTGLINTGFNITNLY